MTEAQLCREEGCAELAVVIGATIAYPGLRIPLCWDHHAYWQAEDPGYYVYRWLVSMAERKKHAQEKGN